VLKHLQSSESWEKKSLGAKGFTLIELLVVIVILGILAAVVVFSVRGVTNNSKDNACKTEKRTLAVAAEAYYADNLNGYPTGSGAALVTKLQTAGLLNKTTDVSGNWTIASDGGVSGTCQGTTY